MWPQVGENSRRKLLTRKLLLGVAISQENRGSLWRGAIPRMQIETGTGFLGRTSEGACQERKPRKNAPRWERLRKGGAMNVKAQQNLLPVEGSYQRAAGEGSLCCLSQGCHDLISVGSFPS